MAVEIQMDLFPFLAAANLSTKQYLIMTYGSGDREVDVADDNDTVYTGILVNKPDTAGMAATVCVNGVCKLIRGAGTITVGIWITADSAGRGVPLTASDGDTVAVIGRVYAIFGAANADEYISVFVKPQSFVTGAAIT